MRNYISLIITIIFFSGICKADKYEIKLKLNNCKDSEIYLAYYFEGKVLVVDTARIDIKGKAVFSKEKNLHGGLYLLYLPSKQYADIILGVDQKFTIEADASKLAQSIKIKGSKENIAFREYQNFMNSQKKKKNSIIKQYKQSSNNQKKDSLKQEINKLDRNVRHYIKDLSLEYPNSALSGFINLTIGPDLSAFESINEKLSKKEQKKLQERYYYYNKTHFWKNISFADSTIIRSPIFKSKLNIFFTEIIVQNPDTVFNESVKLIERSRKNKEMFRYILSYCFNNSLNSKIMGMDAAFVKIAKKYYNSGEAYWQSKENIEKIKEEVAHTEFNLIGLKGKELNLPTMDGDWVSLHETEAEFIVLLFWEPNCGHCKKIIPKIKKELFPKYRDKGLKIFAVYTQRNMQEWEDFVEEYKLFDFIHCYDPHNRSNFRNNYNVFNTPVIYLLNRNKEIIAKKVDITTIDKIIADLLNEKQ